jgi:DNA polymerase-3 subunit gamma/tau
VQGRFKVFMIDEVHMLSNTAFNAMLKTLEEPPEYLKFVLATTDPQKVPVTVLSRCLQFNLRPMAPEVILAHLQGVLTQEQIDAETQALHLIARAARGSMRDALSLTDQAIAFNAGRLQESAVRQMLGSVDGGVVFELIAALAAADGRAVLERIAHLRTQGLSAAAVLEDMAAALQRMAVRQAVPDMPEGDAADAAEIARLAALLPPDETQLLYSLCIHGRAELGLAPDEYAGLTMTLLRLLAFKAGAGAAPAQPVAPPHTAFETAPAEKKTLKFDGAHGSATVPPDGHQADLAPDALRPSEGPLTPTEASVPPVADAAAGTSAADSSEVQAGQAPPPPALDVQSPTPKDTAPHARPASSQQAGFWHALVRQLIEQDTVTALARELALQAELLERAPASADGACEYWTLRVENAALAQTAAGAGSPARERLQAALAQAGYAVRLRVVAGPVADTPASRNAIAADARMKAAQALLDADPFVREIKRDFGATIVPGSLKPL